MFLSADVTPEPGFYDPDRIPYQKHIQEWFTDPRVNDVIICTAAQLIKTTALNNAVGYFVGADPSAVLVQYPTIDDAKDWMTNKFMPMVRSSPPLGKLIPDTSVRTTGQTTLEKHYPGGRVKAIGANSPSALRGRSFRVILQDDLDGFKNTTEGDPSALADKRAANQPRALRIKASTPTLKGHSRIWKWLEQSTFERLLCPCPHCHAEQLMDFWQITWEKDKPETAKYKCKACGDLLDDRERFQMVMTGAKNDHWEVKNPHSKIKGIHMNGTYRLMGEKNSMSGFLEEWIRDYLLAEANGEKSKQVWYNTFLAEPYEPASSTIEPDPLFKRREAYRPWEMLPEQVLVVVAAVDVQSNRLEVETRGYGLGQESWGIEYRVFPGDPTQQAVWDRLDVFLAQNYNHPVRGKQRIACALVDAGGSKQSEAYVFTENKSNRGIWACRGAKELNAPVLSTLRKAGYNSVPFYFVGTQAIKDTLHSRLLLKEHGPGYLHFPISDDFDEDYFKKLTAEKKVVVDKGNNRGKEMWIAPEGARNEPWDINVYMVAAMEAANFTERQLRQFARDNDRIKAQMAMPPPPPSKVTNLDVVLKTPSTASPGAPAEIQADGSIKPAGPPVADPNVAMPSPQSPPVQLQPKKAPWIVRGMGKNGTGIDYSAWGQ